MVTTACESHDQQTEPVDLWTTQTRCPQPHTRNNSTRAEQSEKCVTHVAGQKCYPCPRSLIDLNGRDFFDLAVLDHQYAIGAADQRRPVRDHHTRDGQN
jgi:hypothetical protein